jgi:hypothetical protein
MEMGQAELETVRFMARRVLDQMPSSLEALEVLEMLTPRAQRLTLRERYEHFLMSAPCHRESTRVRELLIDLLLEHRHYDEALAHIAALSRTRVPTLPREEVARACRVPPEGQEPPDPVDEYDELDEFDLEPYDGEEWRAFAFARAAE